MYVINENIKYELMGDLYVLFDDQTSCSFLLNETASHIYNIIINHKNGINLEDIIDEFINVYDVNSDICKENILVFLCQLQDDNIVLFMDI